jgi:deoxyribonuclease IV
MSTAGGGLAKALRDGKAIGCTAVQVFTSSPQQWYAKEISDLAVKEFHAAREATGIFDVVSHDSYLVNLCSADEELRAKSYNGLKQEIERCDRYGVKFLVSHMGKYKGWEGDEAMPLLIDVTKKLLDDTPESVTLLMETTAGQGSAVNSTFEEIARILDALKRPERLAVCLDTCHIFVAGYDIRTEENYEMVFKYFDHLIGLDKLKVIHCNDSQKGLASKIDRHADIGKGEIGPKAFEMLVNDPRFERTPILLETPDNGVGHEENIKTLRSYIP